MRSHTLAAVFGTLGLGALLLCMPDVRGEQPPAPPDRDGAQDLQQEGVEVLTRGPVHEAFAEPVVRSPRPTPVISKKPPEAIEELPPDQRPEGALWIPG